MARTKPTDTPLLWASLLAGPVAWTVQLQSVYALSSRLPEGGSSIPLHAISAACLLATLGGGYLAWRAWRTIGGWPTGTEAPESARVRYLTVLGMMATGLFACVIVAQWLAVGFLPSKVGGG